MIELQLQEKGASRKKRGAVYVYSSDHPHRRSNAALLVLAFTVSLFKLCAWNKLLCVQVHRTLCIARDCSCYN